jgi:hypothetical protein
MDESDQPLRTQIDEAIARIRRELEILSAPSSIGGGADDRGVVADLERELRELLDAREGLGPYDR